MSEQESTALVPTATAAEPEEFPDDLTLLARNPQELQVAQAQLVAWCDRKLASIRAEIEDLGENLDIAIKHKWGTGALDRAHRRAVKRGEFYEKIAAALRAGYSIVPNFPVKLFAVRTKKTGPRVKDHASLRSAGVVESESPPAGEGEFVSDWARVHERTETEQLSEGKTRERKVYWPSAFADEIDFPFSTAKPAILSATAQAMAEKVFDQIGVLPGRRKGDPIIVGQVVLRGAKRWDHKIVSFLVAWFVNTADLP